MAMKPKAEQATIPVFVDRTIDCSRLPCPKPIRAAKHALEALDVGQVLKLIATDEGAPADIREWAQRHGRHLVGTERDGASHIFYIRRTL